MTLWLLRPKDPMPVEWIFGYGQCWGFVIRAETETRARQMAAKAEANEERWNDPTATTCSPLQTNGPEKIIMEEYCDS